MKIRGELKLASQPFPNQFAGSSSNEQNSVSGLVYFNIVIQRQGWCNSGVDLN